MRLELERYLAETPRFDWATANCCHFALGWAKLRSGVDAMAGLPVTRSRWSARRLVRRLGGDLRAAIDARLWTSMPPDQAQSGDLVLVKFGDVELIGIYSGVFVACVTDAGACTLLSMSDAVCAWRMP